MGTPLLHSFCPHGFHGPLFRFSGVKLVGSIIYCCHKSELARASSSHPLPLRFSRFMVSCGNSAFNAKYCGVQALSVVSFPLSLNNLTLEQLANSKERFSLFWKTHPLSKERILYTTERLTVSAARRDGGAKFERLKDLPRKRLRDLANHKGVSDTEIPSPPQNDLKKLPEEDILLSDQAIGQIVSAQANFMRVIVERAGSDVLESPLDRDPARNLKLPVNTISESQEQGIWQKELPRDPERMQLLIHGFLDSSHQQVQAGDMTPRDGDGLVKSGFNDDTPFQRGQKISNASLGLRSDGNHNEDQAKDENRGRLWKVSSEAIVMPTARHGGRRDEGRANEIAKSDAEVKLSVTQIFPIETEGHKECYDEKVAGNGHQKTETLSNRSGGEEPVQTSNISTRENYVNNKGIKETENRGRSSATEKVTLDGVQTEAQHFSDADTDEKVGVELLCVVRALLKKINQKVMVGDRVLVSGVDWIDRRGMIEQVIDRKSEIIDPPVANVDQIIVLFSMDQPRLEPMSLSRFLVEAESTGVPFTLVLNKSDLVLHKELDTWEDKLLSWGYRPLFCSVNTKVGIVPLAQLLTNRMTVIIGPSGVGKSSLINALGDKAGIKSWNNLEVKHLEDEEPAETFDGQILGQMEKRSETFEFQLVGEVSQRSGRGKHTTRNVVLLKLPIGGYLADTPGFNLPCLSKVTSKSLAKLFPEVKEKLAESESGGCVFKDCLHVGEPGCAVGGEWERYPYYLQLLEEVKKREEIELKAFGTKRESEMRYKVGSLGMKQAEPRLEPKRHRRISRQRAKQQIAAELHEEVEEGLNAALRESVGELHKQGEEEVE